MRKLATALLLLAMVANCAGLIAPPWYSCDDILCTSPGCRCPSTTAPSLSMFGSPSDTPQFIIITHDDDVSPLSNKAVRSITDGRKNPNGCNIPATWFVTRGGGTDCGLVKTLWEQNHEIALHTVSHAQLYPENPKMEKEILDVRTWLNETCGLPKEALLGYRAPYLIHNEKVRKILHENGFLYDSSLVEPMKPGSTSETFSQRLFPYTMDNGIVQDCNYTYPEGQCVEGERYPGMWEIPMWDLPKSTENTSVNAYTMDPRGGFGGDLYKLLTTNFDQAYNGNRAPFPLFLHSPWFTPSNVALTNKFFDYVATKPDAYFITIQQLIKWMQNPVPASEIGSFLTCNYVDLKPPPPPTPCQVYQVEMGDYVDLIAGRFEVDPKQLLATNPGITPALIKPGQTLKIPPFNESCGAGILVKNPGIAMPGATTNISMAPADPPAPQCNTWTVEPGQFLSMIANNTGTSLTDIVTINGLNGTDVPLFPGSILKIPPYAACCDTNTCNQTTPAIVPAVDPVTEYATPEDSESISEPYTGPIDRIEMELILKGFSAQAFEIHQGSTQIIAIVSQLLEVSPDRVTAEAEPLVRRLFFLRRRALLQEPAVAETLKVRVRVAAEDPVALYQRAMHEIASGELESLLGAIGLAIKSVPVVIVYKGDVPVDVSQIPLNSSIPAAQTQTPSSSTTTSSSNEILGLPIAAFIGIVAGGSVLIIAVLVGVVILVRRRLRQKAEGTALAEEKGHEVPVAGAMASLKVRSAKLDDSVVIKGEIVSETPTSATFRSNAINGFFRP